MPTTCLLHIEWKFPSATSTAAMHRVEQLARHLRPHASSSSLRSRPCAGEEGPSAASLAAHVRIAPEVAAALREGRAVVALESTIISHGMPYPRNLSTALEVEAEARRGGAVPATIAILSGIIHVGLEPAQLEQLAQLGEKCHKCSRRDLALLVARREHGATTVAATMLVASWVGIRVFVTGGIGGVHRGAESSMDISADLMELGRTPVAVVCAGVKSILDIGRTLEVLETQGVAVASLGTDEFPAFFTPRSGHRSPSRVDSAEEAARMVYSSGQLGLRSGLLLAVPIPVDQAAAAEPTERATAQALDEVTQKRIIGRDITPYLLGRIAELTKGNSLDSNIALIINNVRVGSKVAVEVARLAKQNASGASASTTAATFSASSPTPAASASPSTTSSSSPLPTFPSYPSSFSGPLVIGGSNLDLLGRPEPGTKFLLGTSNPGRIQRSWGGVGRNVAEVLGRLGARPQFLSAVGHDDDGRALVAYAQRAGVETNGTVIRSSAGRGTSTYMAILDEKGDLFTTIADMAVTDELSPAHLPSPAALSTAPMLLMDGNVSQELLESACALAYASRVPVVFEPTSIEKCRRIVGPWLNNACTFLTPSAAELLALHQAVQHAERAEEEARSTRDHNGSGITGPADALSTAAKHVASLLLNVARDAFEHNHHVVAVEAQCRSLLEAVARRAAAAVPARVLRPAHIILKRGAHGALIASLLPSAASEFSITLTHVPAGVLAEPLVNTSGAGDSLVGATAFRLLQLGDEARQGLNLEALKEAVCFGMRAAEMTLASAHSVAPTMSAQELSRRMELFTRSKQESTLARAHAAQR